MRYITIARILFCVACGLTKAYSLNSSSSGHQHVNEHIHPIEVQKFLLATKYLEHHKFCSKKYEEYCGKCCSENSDQRILHNIMSYEFCLIYKKRCFMQHKNLINNFQKHNCITEVNYYNQSESNNNYYDNHRYYDHDQQHKANEKSLRHQRSPYKNLIIPSLSSTPESLLHDNDGETIKFVIPPVLPTSRYRRRLNLLHDTPLINSDVSLPIIPPPSMVPATSDITSVLSVQLTEEMIKQCTPECTLPHCTIACKCANSHLTAHHMCNPPQTSDLVSACQQWYDRCPMYSPVQFGPP